MSGRRPSGRCRGRAGAAAGDSQVLGADEAVDGGWCQAAWQGRAKPSRSPRSYSASTPVRPRPRARCTAYSWTHAHAIHRCIDEPSGGPGPVRRRHSAPHQHLQTTVGAGFPSWVQLCTHRWHWAADGQERQAQRRRRTRRRSWPPRYRPGQHTSRRRADRRRRRSGIRTGGLLPCWRPSGAARPGIRARRWRWRSGGPRGGCWRRAGATASPPTPSSVGPGLRRKERQRKVTTGPAELRRHDWSGVRGARSCSTSSWPPPGPVSCRWWRHQPRGVPPKRTSRSVGSAPWTRRWLTLSARPE